MKKIVFLVCAAFIFSTHGSVHAERVESENEQIAEQVVKSYFDSLMVGDVAGIQRLLGGDLLSERRVMFDNPTYALFLQDFYVRASYQIIKVEMVDDSTVAVQVRLDFGDGNSQDCYFLLDNQYKIISEN